MRLIKKKITQYYKVSSFIVLFLGMLFLLSSPVWADEKDELIQELINRVDQLESKVENLTDKLQVYEEESTATVTEELIQRKVDAILTQKEETQPTIMGMPKITGFIDTTYNYNFNRPASQSTKLGKPGAAVGAEPNLSSYVTKSNDITFNTAHLNLNGFLKEGINYTIELDVGSDASVNTPTVGSGAADDFDLQEAFLTSPLFETGVNLKVGKFVTLEGIEVIESPLDPTISRGYLFGMAEPFTHVGFLLSYPLPIKGLELRAGLVNGWDVLSDNNNRKTVLGGFGINYGDLATGGLSIYHGPEQASNDKNDRTSVDLTIFTKPIPKLTIGLQGNLGREEKAVSGNSDSWKGFGIQPIYQFTDKFSLAGRVEYMDNKLGSRFGSNGGGNLTNFTLTPGYKLNDSATVRVEYRHDVANNSFFEGEDRVFDEKRANQVLGEVFYNF